MKSTKSDQRSLRLERFQDVQLDELVEMWRESFEQGVGVRDFHPIDEQKQYFLTQVAPHNEVRVALLEVRLVGFIAASPESVSQLYVRCGSQRLAEGRARRRTRPLVAVDRIQCHSSCVGRLRHG